MNARRRKEVSNAVMKMREAISELESARNDEQEALDNLPDSLQNGKRGECMQEAIDNLEASISSAEEACEAAELVP